MSRPAARRVAPWMVGVSLLACTPNEQGSDVQATTAAPAASEAGEPAPTSDTPTPAAETDAASEAGEPAPVDTEGTPAAEGETAGEAELDEGPKEPEGYGLFQFPTEPPNEEELTMHAAAGYEVVAVYSAPDAEAARLGFLRIGTRLRASAAIKKDDCKSGWHHLEGGGYACASKGLMVDSKPPYMSYEPAPPRKDDPSPYDWALINKWNAPQWWRVPSGEQYKATYEKRAIREAERLGEPLPGEEPPPAPKPAPSPAPAAGGDDAAAPAEPAALPAPEGEEAAAPEAAPEPAPEAAPEPAPAPDPTPAPDPEPEVEEEPVNIPFSPAAPWLEKGYFVSLGEAVKEEGRGYWRTARGGVVEKKNAYNYEPKDYQGSVLTEDMSFPVGFVMVKGGTKVMRLGKDDKLEATGQNLDKRTFLDLGEEVELGGRTYFTIIEHPEEEGEGGQGETGEQAEPAEPLETLLVKAAVIRQPQLQPIPKGLQPYDRWIDVDISKQMLVAYEGARPVYVTLVSTGKKGTDEEPFETPTGRFRIRSKQLTSNMDGTTATDGNYAIQDVPWVMYFEGSYALHGAFWHRTFGSVRSHGCVNLGPSDARWLYFWTTPFVPDTWHGARSSDDNPGTTIVIRKSEG